MVYPGSKVNVKWRGVWFEGTVIKIGPQRRLCRVRAKCTIHMTLCMSIL